MGKKIKLDMSDMIRKLEEKDKQNKYWGTGSGGGKFNVNTMTPQAKRSGPKTTNINLSQKGTNV